MRFLILSITILISFFLCKRLLNKINLSKSFREYLNALKRINDLKQDLNENKKIFNNISLNGLNLLTKTLILLLPYLFNYFLIKFLNFNELFALIFPSVIYLPIFRKRY